jgi:acyl-coenzyme A thioesterase PaaI-like protein
MEMESAFSAPAGRFFDVPCRFLHRKCVTLQPVALLPGAMVCRKGFLRMGVQRFHKISLHAKKMKKLLNPWTNIPGYNCFGCSPANPAGVHMNFYADGDDVVCLWHPQPQFQGWLNTLHGGIESVLLDEISAWEVMYRFGVTGVTSRMETRFRRGISTEEPYLLLRARLVEHQRNLVAVHATITDPSGRLCTEATCQYFVFTKEQAEKRGIYVSTCLPEGEDVTLEDLIAHAGQS